MFTPLDINPALQADVLRLRAEGLSLSQIGERTGLSKSTCARIVNGRRPAGRSEGGPLKAYLSIADKTSLLSRMRA